MSKCSKCNNDVTENYRFILQECNHTFCMKCTREHVSKYLKIHANNSVKSSITSIPCSIKCPLDKCEKKIQDLIIRQCLSNSETILYDQLSVLSSSKEAVKCLTIKCPYIVFVEKQLKVFQCPYCNRQNCLKCKKRHDGKCNSSTMDEAEIDRLAELSMQSQIRRELEKIVKSNDDILNTEYFECPICYEYILPRRGLSLRKCLDKVCRSCFNELMKNATRMEDLFCSVCNTEIDDREIINVIGKSKFNELQSRSTRGQYFQCKFPNCNGCWDDNNFTGCFTCPVCKHVNCLNCKDIHEGVSCKKFQDSQDNQNKLRFQETIGKPSVKCFFCSMDIVIGEGGCGALLCTCKRHICRYTGKAAGNIGPQSCGCSVDKLCHPDCVNGCFPERNL